MHLGTMQADRSTTAHGTKPTVAATMAAFPETPGETILPAQPAAIVLLVARSMKAQEM